jgi:hypothetical protein
VGINTASPSTALDVNGTVTADGLSVSAASGAAISVANTGTVASVLMSIDSSVNSIYSRGINSSTARDLRFMMGSTEAMRLDASGNLLVGKTSTASNVVGAFILNNGLIRADVDGGVVNVMNRKTSDGDIAVFQKDGATVGSIGAVGGSVYIASPQGTDAGLQFGNSIVGPATTSGSNRDNAIDLGWASNRFKDLYLSGGAYLGGTGSANYLDDYEEGTWSATNVNCTTFPTTTGYYTKVGNMVSVYLSVGGSITAAQAQSFNGLPFTPAQRSSTTVSNSVSTASGVVLVNTDGSIKFTAAYTSAYGIQLTATYRT